MGLVPPHRGLGTPEPRLWANPATPPPPGPLGRHRSFRAEELAEPFEPPVTFKGPPRQNAWAHAPAHQRPHLGQPLRRPHSQRTGPASLLWAKDNPRSAPKGPLPRGQAVPWRVLGTPEPQLQTHPAVPPPPWPLGRRQAFRMGEWSGPSEPRRFRRPPHRNALSHTPARQRPYLGPLLHTPHSQPIQAAGLLGSNPNPRSVPEGHLPRGLAPQRRGLGTPEHQHRTHPAAPLPPGPLGVPLVIQDGRIVRALGALATFEGPPRQKAWAHAPARQRPHLGPPISSPHSRRIGPAGLLGANPNPRSAPEWPLTRGLAPQAR